MRVYYAAEPLNISILFYFICDKSIEEKKNKRPTMTIMGDTTTMIFIEIHFSVTFIIFTFLSSVDSKTV